MFENYELEILYKDEYLVAINKPTGLLVHKSMIDKHEIYFAMKILSKQIGKWVYPIHRLDKPTSGVLLFALDSHTAKLMSEQFSSHAIEKTYIAIGRGYVAEEGVIEHALLEKLDKISDRDKSKTQEAKEASTAFRCLGQVEIDAKVGRYDTVRYSLVELKPRTGRKHQLRRHMKHINHHLLGDTKYGRGEHNKFVRERYEMHRLMLHALRLEVKHLYTEESLVIQAPLDEVFLRVLKEFKFSM
ncbi:pseudouridylate synthase [Sulfurimonas sp. SAG-AH-194-C20]|nr:pseudouridine synthase [Sulfurimonas sp. SAG-AH-194-C20]MDF1878475.1 pseudouridylate synthase [Sulfurimonas sp. SAG-AH-194-C20]